MNTSSPAITIDRALAAHGAIMTFLGLLSGFTTMFAKSPHTALEAHSIGVVKGALLFGLAAIWPALGRNGVVTAARVSALVGLYANWIGAQLAALWSAKGMMVVSGSSMPGGATPWMELIVKILLQVSTLVMVMCLLILWALKKSNKSSRPSHADGSVLSGR